MITGGLRILFATDGSRGSAAAEAYARGLARSWDASLTVMNVLEFPSGLDPENLPEFNRELHLGSSEKRAWKNIWSAGQGVGAIQDTPSTAALVARLRREYAEAIAGLDQGFG